MAEEIKKKNKKGKKNDVNVSIFSLDECIKQWIGINPIANISKVTKIVPIKKSHKLILTWPLPPSAGSDYKMKNCFYLSHLLGHEGSGSLLSGLKKNCFALALSAGITDENQMFTLFSITIVLTDEGICNWIAVVQHVNAYLNMLRSNGPQEWIYEEIKQIAQIEFGNILKYFAYCIYKIFFKIIWTKKIHQILLRN